MHSPRALAARATEFREELRAQLEPDPQLEFVLHEVARLAALIDAIDRALDEQGIVNARGKPTYLVDMRIRASRQFERWLDKLIAGCTDGGSQPILQGERSDYIAKAQDIALRKPDVSTALQLQALQLLLREGRRGTTSGVLADEERGAALRDDARREGASFTRTEDG